MSTHSSILACEIPWTEEPGGLRGMEGMLMSMGPWHPYPQDSSRLQHTELSRSPGSEPGRPPAWWPSPSPQPHPASLGRWASSPPGGSRGLATTPVLQSMPRSPGTELGLGSSSPGGRWVLLCRHQCNGPLVQGTVPRPPMPLLTYRGVKG